MTGSGSLWTNNGFLHIGSWGSSNTLLIANGGTVANSVGRIGSASSNNLVTVTGTNSLWNSGFLAVGSFGSLNTLL
ncbi:MAG: hypothetical protein HC814_07225, partial [Rhodobacteraceae bacterium]|nr:hypothetical protein [Paracoccaceae bacterium]